MRATRWMVIAIVSVVSLSGTEALEAQSTASLLERARALVGTPYCHGGETPACFDCSGFVHYLYRGRVAGLPRWSREMARHGTPVARDELVPGDLLFFATGGRPDIVTHVALYVGQDSIVHAISDGPNRGVSLTRLDARYWRERFHSAVRVIAAAPDEQSYTDEMRFALGIYRGELRYGEPHGTGVLALDNGDRYEGTFHDGLFHGEGVYRWRDGAVYRGTFDRGERHGDGVYLAVDGAEQRGTWRDGELVAVDDASGARADADPRERDAAAARPTYRETHRSPWDSYDGIVEGDFQAWRAEQDRAFREFLRENS